MPADDKLLVDDDVDDDKDTVDASSSELVGPVNEEKNFKAGREAILEVVVLTRLVDGTASARPGTADTAQQHIITADTTSSVNQ